METFELLPSLAQGELAEASAPELVAAVFRSRASGTLWLETPETEIRCFFRAGDMCGTASFKGFQTLAHVLLVNDWVAALDIESSREEAAAKGQRHGEVLVERALLTQDQLRTALGAQHTANLTTLLSLTQGKYDWRGWEPPPPWAREVVVDPVSCLVDALELELHAPRRRRVLQWLGSNPARLSMDWPELQGRVTFGPVERRAAALLALPRKLDEFVQASRLPQTRAEALVVALLLAGGVEPQPQASAPPARGAKRPAEPILEPLPEPEAAPPEPELQPEPELLHLEPESHDELQLAPAPELVSEPEPELFPDPGLRHEPAPDPFAEPRLQEPQPRRGAVADEEDALARVDSLSLDDLTPTPDAAPELPEDRLEIDHRPRHGKVAAGGSTAPSPRDEPTLDLASSSGEPPPEEERSRELRKKLMARGMRNLGGAPAGRPDDSALLDALPDPVRMDETGLSREGQSFVDEVRSRARLAPGQSAYARLGVSPGAPMEQIKTAYLTLAKRFHPDRSSAPGMSGMQPELQSLFLLLKEGYDSIASPNQRATYDSQLKTGGVSGRPSSRREEAVLSLKMGEVLLKKRDFEGALNKLRRSVDLDATGDALAALAWALVADPKGSPAAKEEAAGLINRALRAPGVTARTYYVAGVFWRTKDPDSAVDAFRKALEMDPQHSDAALELRLIEQRRGKHSKTGGGVLSGLLFGKRKS